MASVHRVRGTAVAVLRWAREGLLTLAALAGLVCMVALVAVHVFDVSLMVFRSGSMSPTIPEGSVAVVRTVPATSVEVGDVVTVRTPRSPYPVTHRVVAIERVAGDRDTVVLTMKGDANDTVDPFPYRVDEVQAVLWAVPSVGRVVAHAQSPVVLGAVTVVMTGVVVWTFWPRRPRASRLTTVAAALAPGEVRS